MRGSKNWAGQFSHFSAFMVLEAAHPQSPSSPAMLLWYVAHTRPRREKKLAQYCQRENFPVTLPCYRVVHKYQGKTRKTVVFEKPLFPGYVFLQLMPAQRQRVYQSDYVANLLEVVDQALFVQQLDAVLKALEADLDVWVVPQIQPGQRVRITRGPLQGLEGWVEQRQRPGTVLLRIDFISQAAAVQMDIHDFELA